MLAQRKGTASAELAANPRYEMYEFHSGIVRDARDVAVYLPAQYFVDEKRRFPVLYLHDGQNLFDELTSFIPGKTWRAHTTTDELAAAGEIEPVILVGVANTGLRRVTEYTPTRDLKLGGGEGSSYGRMLMEELKPFVDRAYRTRAGAEDTGLGGSSLGGLISLYLGLKYPEVFGGLAVMSPSLWWNDRNIFGAVEEAKSGPRIWLDMGTAEGMRHVQDADRLYGLLLKLGWQPGVDLMYVKALGAVHDEEAWALRFGDVLRFLFPAR
jgi:predicted alpha/beta superfamily hydrolase